MPLKAGYKEGVNVMKIEILGVGCPNCDALYENTLEAVKSAGIESEVSVSKIGDIDTFMKMGVFTTPALAINDEVVSVGRVLEVEEIVERIRKSSK